MVGTILYTTLFFYHHLNHLSRIFSKWACFWQMVAGKWPFNIKTIKHRKLATVKAGFELWELMHFVCSRLTKYPLGDFPHKANMLRIPIGLCTKRIPSGEIQLHQKLRNSFLCFVCTLRSDREKRQWKRDVWPFFNLTFCRRIGNIFSVDIVFEVCVWFSIRERKKCIFKTFCWFWCLDCIWDKLVDIRGWAPFSDYHEWQIKSGSWILHPERTQRSRQPSAKICKCNNTLLHGKPS